jgi:hypothetical protein
VIAGLEVLRIINEPTAAAIAYGLDKKVGKRRCDIWQNATQENDTGQNLVTANSCFFYLRVCSSNT